MRLARKILKHWRWLAGSIVVMILSISVITCFSLQPVPADLHAVSNSIVKHQYLDRYARRMNLTYENQWNVHDVLPLHAMPAFMQRAIMAAEDKRFYQHNGVDWLARMAALQQNIFAARGVRGASTISEQVIKMLHRRPRNAWTRWLEGLEAQQLEQQASKADIIEFYLNQVPYAARRRGIKQAAAYYFDRDVSTLNKREMLALAIMVRAPKWYDPYHYPRKLSKTIDKLAQRMQADGAIDQDTLQAILQQQLNTRRPSLDVDVRHFIKYVKEQRTSAATDASGHVHTTLDLELQQKLQRVLDSNLDKLAQAHVQNAAALIVNHHTNEIRAWAVGYAADKDKPFTAINSVLVARQAGSTLKPFLYAQAMQQGWHPATMIADTPLQQSVGAGLHPYHNYSRQHYGLISLREALGNSLNIPAVRTVQFIGSTHFLNLLHAVGIQHLHQHPNVYGDGIALGNGEVSLLELTQAYTTLARMGNFKPLSVLPGQATYTQTQQVLDADVASLLANILSDPQAREKEFGTYSILNLPQQTAVKTGTSSDYRDAWALGYNDQYTIGVWFGNMDYSSMHNITGASGPAIVLRTMFNEVNRGRRIHALYFSPRLIKKQVCAASGLPADTQCASKDEWFHPAAVLAAEQSAPTTAPRLRKPSNGLHIAMDPRIPDQHEVFEFEVSDHPDLRQVDWYVNDSLMASSTGNIYPWQIHKGAFNAYAQIYLRGQSQPLRTQTVHYLVK